MHNNLVIVESPAKAKTIEKFLGDGYKVLSSYGHIRDLRKQAGGIDIEHNFTPLYEVPKDKEKVVAELKKEAKKADTVWLASDEDREGEAISWHLSEVLKLDPEKTKRIVFHEITKPAIQNAIEHPRTINLDLVDAQQARRVLDRIVGFELSPVLWRKIKPSLSAGRVQSVTVRLIVEKERELQAFVSEAFYKVVAQFITTDGSSIKADFSKRFKTEKEAQAFLESCKGKTFTVEDVATKPLKRTPAAPFTTSTLQQEAARKLGYTVAQTMMLAQQLYESGKITYMRTDSVNLSELALQASKETILAKMGEKYVQTRHYTTHTKGAQEAHEAIRPTDMSKSTIEGTGQEKRLYNLIWKRTIASQMADAELKKTTITISMSGEAESFVATGEVIVFDGFLKVYRESNDDDNEQDSETGLLPALEKGEKLSYQDITAVERFSQPPARYTEASLVRKLEELGIGRPSTYAPTISTIQQRGYVEKGSREGVERKFTVLSLKGDKIEKKWTDVMEHFYEGFHPLVEDSIAAKSEHKVGERLLGTDPVSGKPVSVKIGRFGPVVQIGMVEDEEKPRFAQLKKEYSMETITLEQALELFKLPRTLGELEGKTVTVGAGRFGPYVRYDNQYVSIPKTMDPLTISLEEAEELIKAKKEAEAKKVIKTFDEEPELQILNGRYGPYISYKKENYKIPKTVEAADLTLEACFSVIKLQQEKGSGRKTTRSTAKKK